MALFIPRILKQGKQAESFLLVERKNPGELQSNPKHYN